MSNSGPAKAGSGEAGFCLRGKEGPPNSRRTRNTVSMTSLVCWVGIDHRKISSIYLASDSRITHQESGRVLSDSAQKVFACVTRPEIFGYCGNAGAPPAVLASLVREFDTGAMGSRADYAYIRAQTVQQYLSERLPIAEHGRKYDETLILYGTREGEGYREARFSLSKFFVENGTWAWAVLDFPTSSDIIVAEGSGHEQVRRWREHWVSAQGRVRTSRAVFSALCNALRSKADPRSGGPPQLVGMYQEGLPQTFGVIFDGARYVVGRNALADAASHWRDDLFQLCDGASMKPLADAARHHRPKGL